MFTTYFTDARILITQICPLIIAFCCYFSCGYSIQLNTKLVWLLWELKGLYQYRSRHFRLTISKITIILFSWISAFHQNNFGNEPLKLLQNYCLKNLKEISWMAYGTLTCFFNTKEKKIQIFIIIFIAQKDTILVFYHCIGEIHRQQTDKLFLCIFNHHSPHYQQLHSTDIHPSFVITHRDV